MGEPIRETQQVLPLRRTWVREKKIKNRPLFLIPFYDRTRDRLQPASLPRRRGRGELNPYPIAFKVVHADIIVTSSALSSFQKNREIAFEISTYEGNSRQIRLDCPIL